MRHDPSDSPSTKHGNPFAITQMDNDYDALAELFLGGESAHAGAATLSEPKVDVQAQTTTPIAADPISTIKSTPPVQDIPRRANIEALILGHLPGMASPWASQYAAALADQLDEPVGLIRLTEGELSIEIVAGAESDPAMMPIEQAIAHLMSRTSRVLIRVDAVHEPQVVSSKLLDAITILSGADEAAVVSSYRTMKGIAGQRPHGESTRFQAAIMGVNPHDAQRALTHLRRAVRTFLDDELTQAPGMQRVGPVSKATLCRESFSETIEDLLTLIETAPHSRTGVSSASIVAESSLTAEPVIPPTHQTESDEQVAAPACTAKVGSSLAHRLAGLNPLQSRCPHCEGIELAADQTGRLHLLILDNPSAIGDLIAVKAWGRAHGSILSWAEPLLTATAEEPALHVFTDRPAAARQLLDTPVHVHLLARAASDGFVCLPLNDPV